MQKPVLTILKKIGEHPVVSSYLTYLSDKTEENFALFLREVYLFGAQDDLTSFVERLVLEDENAFSVSASANETLSPFLRNGMMRDLTLLHDALFSEPQSHYFGREESHRPFTGDWGNDETIDALSALYLKGGYGKFLFYRAFRYEKQLVPVCSPSKITAYDLKGYAYEKKTIEDNLISFLDGFPFSNMLLYGDRGTGKSSTIHAMLNKYAERGLRLVELPKEDLNTLSHLKRTLVNIPLKFIIFIDDLSLEENDPSISTLKAALEGSVSETAENTMIVATSNRRHIVRESFAERENSVHAGDQMQEQLSLSDRFGISVYFSTTGKVEYLDIVNKLADDMGLEYDRAKLDALAERWALLKGGRSPRRAKQFVNLAYSYVSQGKEITL